MAGHWFPKHWVGETSSGGDTTPPTPPTLALTGNAAEPTGATATIAGTDGASTNTVSYQLVNYGFVPVPGTWTSAGSRTGDGSLALALPKGLYWFRCDSVLNGLATVSNLVFLAVTDGMDAVHERCLQSIVANLQTLVAAELIPGITAGTRVYSQIELDIESVTFPCLVVCTNLPGQVGTELQLDGTNERDDIGYPCFVVQLDRSPGDFVPNRADYLKGREVVFRFFRNQRLAGVDEVYTTRVEPGPVLKIETDRFEIIGSVLVIRPISREARGV